ncbi:hypothetical protein NQ317_015975 [Molorchus minor]|uniref:GH18 domain-containing protein n=1 Tax=Molorchus minor TaxID=1323400 RepID=A0ABQ9JSR1_9CUCU|nr:hypothetical protein NQ317_015975 [Molorchus minor]
MRLILAIIIVLLCGSHALSEDADCERKTEVICYWGSWSIYREGIGHFTTEDIDPTLYSEISSLDTWADIDLGGFENITSIKENYTCLKIVLAIGGWNEGSIKYSVMAATAESRKKFAEGVLRYLVYYGFDGLDLDWEYPTSRGGILEDGQNFASLVTEIKKTISPWNLTLSIAVSIDTSLIGFAYNISAIEQNVDFVNLMAYDYVLPATANVTGLSSPLTAIKETVSSWLDAGLSREKLILGIPTYARTYILADDNGHNIGDPVIGEAEPGEFTKEAGFLAYYELLDLMQDAFLDITSVQTDDTNYAYGSNEWYTYETETTVRAKTMYAIDQHLGGIMVWSIDTDDFLGLYGKKYPLLKTISEVIMENEPRKK